MKMEKMIKPKPVCAKPIEVSSGSLENAILENGVSNTPTPLTVEQAWARRVERLSKENKEKEDRVNLEKIDQEMAQDESRKVILERHLKNITESISYELTGDTEKLSLAELAKYVSKHNLVEEFQFESGKVYKVTTHVESKESGPRYCSDISKIMFFKGLRNSDILIGNTIGELIGMGRYESVTDVFRIHGTFPNGPDYTFYSDEEKLMSDLLISNFRGSLRIILTRETRLENTLLGMFLEYMRLVI